MPHISSYFFNECMKILLAFVEKEVEDLLKDIKNCLEKTCPKKSPHGVSPRKASRIKNWWDPTAEKARETSMRLRQEYLHWIKERKKFFATFPETESLLDDIENHGSDNEQENTDLLIRPENEDNDDYTKSQEQIETRDVHETTQGTPPLSEQKFISTSIFKTTLNSS